MLIVDAQIHIWTKGTPSPWHRQYMAVTRGAKGAVSYRTLSALLALAWHPNVAVKATGQAGYAENVYPFPSLHDKLRAVYDAFGPTRMFWGTDITRMPCSWRQCVFTEALPWLKGSSS
jgi:predicted TIM-barrel fold metal-dependent hydrolase